MTDAPDVRIGVRGGIVQGDDAGLTVFVEDDSANGGGFLILVGQDPDEPHGYDDWVATRRHLEGYFDASRWVVEWEAIDAPGA